ncbi:MAG: DUF4352 domain-containing protein [Bacilli bacterium]|nr:DUF4352 domain-containing protein [Bacilli bacterium]
MKKCKYCQTEIDKKAKICPNCHKKQSHIVRWVILGLLAIIVVGVIAGGSGEEDKFQKEYNQNDMVTYKDVNYSIISVDKTKGSNQYFQAKDGYEFVKVKIKIENKSDKKISYNALDFQMVNGDGVEASVYSITAEDDVQLHSGELDAGGKIEGVIIWEQKQNDTNLKVRYYENVLFDDDYTFQWTLD